MKHVHTSQPPSTSFVIDLHADNTFWTEMATAHLHAALGYTGGGGNNSVFKIAKLFTMFWANIAKPWLKQPLLFKKNNNPSKFPLELLNKVLTSTIYLVNNSPWKNWDNEQAVPWIFKVVIAMETISRNSTFKYQRHIMIQWQEKKI